MYILHCPFIPNCVSHTLPVNSECANHSLSILDIQKFFVSSQIFFMCFLLYKLNLAITYFSCFSPLFFTASWEVSVPLYSCELMPGPQYGFQHIRSTTLTSKTHTSNHISRSLTSLAVWNLHQTAEHIGNISYRWEKEQGSSRYTLGQFKNNSSSNSSLFRV